MSDSNPLCGVRVLDLATGPLGAIGRTLAELGADLVRVEPPSGGADRLGGPAVAGVGLGFAAANLGKRGVALDLSTGAGRAELEALAAAADILIETTRAGSDEAGWLDPVGLRVRNPGLVVLSISDFGDGVYADWQATDAVLHALSGELSRSGIPGRAPLLPPGELAIQCAAAQGAYAVLIAYLDRLIAGEGDHLHLSLLDAAAQALDPGYGIAGSAAMGEPPSKLPRGRPEARHQYPILPCKDGFARLTILAARQWQGMLEWMGSPPEFADPAFNNVRHRFASTTLLLRIAEFFADKTRAEIEAQGARYRVPAAGLLTLEEVLGSEQIEARQALALVEIAPGVSAPFPDGVMEIDGRRAGLRGAPPVPGGNVQALLDAWRTPRPGRGKLHEFGAPGRPLAGLRVLDLGVIVVGSEQGRLLADYGADVIKVENAAFPDGARVSGPDEITISFAAGHRNKKGLGLNLRAPEGRELFLRLAEKSDVILSNFKPGTLESLGLGADILLARNPRLILADSSAFGTTGPWNGRLGYGPLVRASAGLTLLWSYPDEAQGFTDAMTVYPDHVAARVGVSGILALLVRRLRTGRGGTVSISQTEVMLSHMADRIAAIGLQHDGHNLEGPPWRDAPWGVFACAGDDEWCVVTVRGDTDWKALCGVIGRPELALDGAFATAAVRAAKRVEVDGLIAAWIADRTPQDAMEMLQAAGVPAGAMLRVAELPKFGAFQESGLFQPMFQPGFDESFLVDNRPVRAGRLQTPPLAPAPRLGEHTREIARDLLTLSESEIDRLIAAKVLESPDTP